MKAGDLVRFKSDMSSRPELILVTYVLSAQFGGVFATGERNGMGITSYISLIERISGDS